MNYANSRSLWAFLFTVSAVTFSASSASAVFQGDEFYENSSGTPIIRLLQGAKSSIDIETYEMDDPAVDREIRAALGRGVKLNIIQESSPVGASCHAFGGSTSASSQTPACIRQQDLVNFVTSHGGQYVPFSKSLCGKPGSRCYEHGKIAIFDNSTAFLSTGNFNATSLCDVAAGPKNCDRDYTLLSRDTNVINSLQTVFNNDLAGQASNLLNLPSTRVTVSPESMKPIVDFIGSAKSTLQIETQYLKDPTMNQAIIDAAKRGVNVTVMVSSACSFGIPKGGEVTKWNDTYSSFDSAGIKTRIFDGNIKVGGLKGYLHAKAIIVDSVHAWIGSVNGSTTALTDNREFGMFIDDTNLISKLNQYVSSDFASTQGESWQDSIVCKYDHGSHP